MGQHQEDVHQIDDSPGVGVHRSRFHPEGDGKDEEEAIRSISVDPSTNTKRGRRERRRMEKI